MPSSPRKPESGFALILVLSLLSVLVIAVYAIALLSRVEADVGAAETHQLRARQSALLGLRLALAELQRAAGESTAITASANIQRTGSAAPPYQQLLGVWPAGSSDATPANWFVSGNFEHAGPRQITPAALPAESASSITLLGAGSVSAPRDMARAARVPIEGSHAGYAFWIGDQGAKAALAVTAAQAPQAPSGQPLLADPRRDLPSFAHDSPQRAQPIIWEELRHLVGGANLKSRFRSYSTRAYWAEGGALQAGLFNINTSNPISWEAVLRAYETARAASQPPLDATAAQLLAEHIAAELGPAEAVGKSRYGPFLSVDAFWDSQLVQEALDALGFDELSQADLRSVLAPMLRARSDTFLIRAYGDALSPAAAGAPLAPVQARAYCEALVQRSPEPAPLGHGQRFTLLYFRWLLPEEI